MGLPEILTVVFIILKLCNVIDWSWWLVLLPEIIAVGMCIIIFIIYGITYLVVSRGNHNV